jgi:uncharacterized phage-like protein YoqJ
MKIAFTGHRPNKLGNEYDMKGAYSDHIRKEIIELINTLKPTLMISGLALGVDTIAALLALEFNIPLMVCIPFEGQEKRWKPEQQKLYHDILLKATIVRITGTPGYEAWKMDVRNKYMVDQLEATDVLVGVHNGDQSGGTWNCLEYARRKEKQIIIINPTPKELYYENLSEADRENIRIVERMWDV